jgi:outer membrane biosynthesis protein TonB
MVTSAEEQSFENRNNLIGWSVSVLAHVIILLIMFFSMAWERQNPPPLEYGMEVNFGLDDEGFGEVQETNPANQDPQPQKTSTSPAQQEETEPVIEEKTETENVIRGDADVAIPPPNPEPVKKTNPVVVEKPKTNPTKPAAPESLFPSEKGGSASNNNGNKPGTTGDMGKADGNPDVRGIYDGNPGKGKGGSSLDMAGWRWDTKPKVNDESNEEGKIVFQVNVDEEGNIVSVTVLEKSVSPALVRKYQKEVEGLSFSRTSGGNNGKGANGRITFLITSK